MRNSNPCPKCQSRDNVKIPGTVGGYGAGNNIPIGMWVAPVKVTRYLCCSCGFCEEWIESAPDIAQLKEKYGK